MTKMNPWKPMNDPVDLKTIGKLSEELGELSAIVGRCIIQGVDEVEPVTRIKNRFSLEDEIADVLANIELVMARFDLDEDRIKRRALKKIEQLKIWHRMA